MAVSFIGGWNRRTQPLSHYVVSSTPRNERVSKLTSLVVIGTDCTGSCKSNYYKVTTPLYYGPNLCYKHNKNNLSSLIVDGHEGVFKVKCLINKRLKPNKSNHANILH